MKSNIGLKKITAEAGSAVLIKDDSRSKIKSYRARVSRSPTLDGGSVIENLGYSNGDREIEIIAIISEADQAKIESMIVDENYIVVSTRDGVFYGSIDNVVTDRGQMSLKFLAQERDDE